MLQQSYLYVVLIRIVNENISKNNNNEKRMIMWKLNIQLINPRAYQEGEGAGVDATPIRFSFNFPKAIFHQHRPLSVAVGISLRHILTQVWWNSVAKVTKYYVTSIRWPRHFWVKICFSPFFRWKSQKYTTSSKVFNYSYFTWLPSTISSFRRFFIISNFW